MNKEKRVAWRTKLGTKLLGRVSVSLIISIILFAAMAVPGYQMMTDLIYSPAHLQKQAYKLGDDFQKYLEDNNISIRDRSALLKWIDQYPDMVIYLFMDGSPVIHAGPLAYDNEDSEPLTVQDISDISDGYVKLEYPEGTVEILLFYFGGTVYYVSLLIGCFLVAFIFFLALFLWMIKGRIWYIGKLEQEMQVLESGDLNQPVTILGNDELADLAQSIEDMRVSVMERIDNEDRAKQANNELITAMSHDLRTPLTKQIGFLDIIYYKKYQSEEQLFEYIGKAREKAYQIKTMSDKLFQYFLAFDMEEEEVELELLDGREVLNQMIAEQVLDLRSAGYHVLFTQFEDEFWLEINPDELYRIFDNLFSNIRKYADPKELVEIWNKIHEDHITLTFTNHILRNKIQPESTRIGLKSVERLLEHIGGKLQTTMEADIFLLKMEISSGHFKNSPARK